MSVAYAPQQANAQQGQQGYNEPGPQYDEGQLDLLARTLRLEEERALQFAQSDLNDSFVEALKHYQGEPYGDEEEGRSQVVTRELFEQIQWTMAAFMRVFCGGGNILSLEATSEQDAKYADSAADYLNWILQSDNPGFRLLYNFGFDGLLQKNGWMSCYWRDKEYRAPQLLTGLNVMQVMQLHQDPAIEVMGQDFDQESEAGGIRLLVRRTKSAARVEICCIAPEDMRVSGRTEDIEDPRYIGCVRRMLLGEVMRLYPEHAEELMGYANKGLTSSMKNAEVRQERFGDDSSMWNNTAEPKGVSIEVEVLEEYLRIDLDGDNYPELVRSYRCGAILLEASEVEEHPFGTWSPHPVPHRLIGQSYDDVMGDLQKRSTVLNRAALDATYQSVVNREAYDKNRVTDVGALMATYAGAKIPVDGPPGEAIMPLTGGIDTAQVAWTALAQLDVMVQNRVGRPPQGQGMDPDALLKNEHSGKAIDLLQTAGAARQELLARHMGDGLEAFLGKVYRLVCRNQNEERQLRIGGKTCSFDPRSWNSDLRVRVHTGLGTGNRDQTLMGLQIIAQRQQAYVDYLGPDNPFVTAANMSRTDDETCRALGYHSKDAFFSEPQPQPVQGPDGQPQIDPQTGQPAMQDWKPPPKQDPAMAKVQADAQAAQAMHQLKTEEAQATLALQQQKDQAALQTTKEEAALKLQIMRDTAANEQRLAEQKAIAEATLAQQKADAEYQLAVQQADREYQLALMEIASKERIAMEQLKHQREMHGEKLDATTEMHTEKVEADVQMSKNRPGGALDE